MLESIFYFCDKNELIFILINYNILKKNSGIVSFLFDRFYFSYFQLSLRTIFTTIFVVKKIPARMLELVDRHG